MKGIDKDSSLDSNAEKERLSSENNEKFSIPENISGKKIDEDSERLTAIYSRFNLNENQRGEVVELLKEQLENSVASLKDEVKQDSRDTKKDFLTFFGLFASFVTFLSIEVQLFKTNDNIFELLGVTSISFAFVMFFALILNEISKGGSELKDLKKPSYLLNILFLVAGVLCLFYGGCKDTSKLKYLENKSKSDSIQIQQLQKDQIKSKQEILKLDTLFKGR